MTNSFLKLATEGNKNAILKQQIICQYILCGDSSITDLSKAVNLSVPTVTKLIGELIDEGFVHNFGEQGTAGGRRPNIYGLNPYAGYFIGVDIRKDSAVMAAINFKGQLIDETTVAFCMDNDPRSLDALCEAILNFVGSHKIAREKVLAIGVNISGRVNSQTGYSYSYFFVEEQPLTMLLEERLGTTVYIENDTRAATYGEYMYGDAHNEQTMLYINASWGLGLGMIIDGKIFYGKSGFSGEFGHFPLLDNEIICRCGKRGCLETGASGSAMHRIFLEKLRQGRVSMLSAKFKKGEEITLNDILDALQKEDVRSLLGQAAPDLRGIHVTIGHGAISCEEYPSPSTFASLLSGHDAVSIWRTVLLKACVSAAGLEPGADMPHSGAEWKTLRQDTIRSLTRLADEEGGTQPFPREAIETRLMRSGRYRVQAAIQNAVNAKLEELILNKADSTTAMQELVDAVNGAL